MELGFIVLLAIIGAVAVYAIKSAARPQWEKDLDYYRKLSKLSPEEREKRIARDAAIKTEAMIRDVNKKIMREHGLKSEDEFIAWLNSDIKKNGNGPING